MSKLTNKQRLALDAILNDARRALKYLNNESVVIANKACEPTTTLHFRRAQPNPACDDGAGMFIVPVAKYGSDIVGLESAIRKLERFINGPTIEN